MEGHRKKRRKVGLGDDEEATGDTVRSNGMDTVDVQKLERAAPKVTGPQGGISSNWMKMKAEIASSGRQKRGSHPRATSLQAAAKVVQQVAEDEKVGSPQPLGKDMGPTKVVAMDCEMVGVGDDGVRSILARVCLVNAHGNVLYDKHVQPLERVTDYRTHVSGVRAKDLKKTAEEFFQVQKEVAALLKDRIVVGHALQNDMQALLLSHPKRFIRDTSKYAPLRKHGRPRALRHLAEEILGLRIQAGEHSPVDDARAALYIYLKFKKDWEQSLLPKKQKRIQAPEKTPAKSEKR
ncbi:hypothetical protein KFL_001620210 [Klebsormidium nitens]|uniref:RNA exonuclease 4 n=1 Tax=Klebsormidium nitens TaxID=105231 RepID=A0A1Y1I3P7_KLENI|nr:hypothetical protein KFL_001620210 [Klebsormidium nitens]|eukprot:GAQ83801.1 hypothetical protein KFL_001620210 [Klebsormidium nitens]